MWCHGRQKLMKARGEISAEMLITIWRWDLVSALQHHIAIRWAELRVEGLFQDWNDLLAMILGKCQFVTTLLHMHELVAPHSPNTQKTNSPQQSLHFWYVRLFYFGER